MDLWSPLVRDIGQPPGRVEEAFSHFKAKGSPCVLRWQEPMLLIHWAGLQGAFLEDNQLKLTERNSLCQKRPLSELKIEQKLSPFVQTGLDPFC